MKLVLGVSRYEYALAILWLSYCPNCPNCVADRNTLAITKIFAKNMKTARVAALLLLAGLCVGVFTITGFTFRPRHKRVNFLPTPHGKPPTDVSVRQTAVSSQQKTKAVTLRPSRSPPRLHMVFFAFLSAGKKPTAVVISLFSKYMKLLEDLKLFQSCASVSLVVNIDPNDLDRAKKAKELFLARPGSAKKSVEMHDGNEHEYRGILRVFTLAKQYPNDVIGYAHIKGITRDSNAHAFGLRYTRAVFAPWKAILDMFWKCPFVMKAGSTCSKANWLWHTVFIVRASHVISVLKEPRYELKNRWYYESWSGASVEWDDRKKVRNWPQANDNSNCFSLVSLQAGSSFEPTDVHRPMSSFQLIEVSPSVCVANATETLIWSRYYQVGGHRAPVRRVDFARQQRINKRNREIIIARRAAMKIAQEQMFRKRGRNSKYSNGPGMIQIEPGSRKNRN